MVTGHFSRESIFLVGSQLPDSNGRDFVQRVFNPLDAGQHRGTQGQAQEGLRAGRLGRAFLTLLLESHTLAGHVLGLLAICLWKPSCGAFWRGGLIGKLVEHYEDFPARQTWA